MFNSPNKSVGVINGVPDFPADGNDYVFQGDNTWKVLPPSPGKNLIINGSMNVSQRPSLADSPPQSDKFYIDRFQTFIAGSGVSGNWNMGQSVQQFPGGFSSSYNIKSVNGQYTPSSNTGFLLGHAIEGNNFNRLNQGTASAKPFTVSFYMWTQVAGNYPITVSLDLESGAQKIQTKDCYHPGNGDFEKMVYTFSPYDEAGDYLKTGSERAAAIWIPLASSPIYSQAGLAKDTWLTRSGSEFFNSDFTLNPFTSAGNEIFLTGFQLEEGEEATEFEHEDYGTTLLKCQRYCELIKIPFQGIYSSATFSGGSGTTANIGIFFKVEKRVIPTAPPSNSINYRAAAISFPTPTGPVDIYCESKILFRGISGVIAEVGVPVHFYTESSAIPVGPPCIFDAEL